MYVYLIIYINSVLVSKRQNKMGDNPNDMSYPHPNKTNKVKNESIFILL